MAYFLLKTQIAILLNQDITRSKVLEMSSGISKEYDDTLPVTIPVDDDDIPMMIFNSNDGKFSLEIRKRRLDFHFKPSSDNPVTDIDDIKPKIETILDILKDGSIPFTKCGIVIEFLKEDVNPSNVFSTVNISPFFINQQDDTTYNVVKKGTKEIHPYGKLLQNIYIDTGVSHANNQTKYQLLGIDMNNFNALGENISTSDKVIIFVDKVFEEFKDNFNSYLV